MGLLHRYNVLIFDLPGHGLSSGEPAVIDDFSDYSLRHCRRTARRQPAVVATVGHGPEYRLRGPRGLRE